MRLAMIVRDEAPIIARCLASAKPWITSWTIVDTGSIDSTREIVRELLADIPGELVERPWIDFASNRTELMSLAAGGDDDLVLLLDADLTVSVDRPVRLLADAGRVRVRDRYMSYHRDLLVRGGHSWRFEGPVHEVLTSDRPFTVARVEGLVVTHHADGSSRTAKIARDRDALTNLLRSRPGDPRSLFYLALTETAAGNVEDALRLFEARLHVEAASEEAWYARYRRALLLLQRDGDSRPLEEALEQRPTRAEPLHDLARFHRLRGHFDQALRLAARARDIPRPEDQLLFVHDYVYDWASDLEWTIAATHLGDLEGAMSTNRALLSRVLPADVRARVERNQQICEELLRRRRARLEM